MVVVAVVFTPQLLMNSKCECEWMNKWMDVRGKYPNCVEDDDDAEMYCLSYSMVILLNVSV